MSFLYLTGSKLNTFSRGTVSISPSAASVSDAANLYDGDPGCPLLFGSAAAGYAKVDCNALINPGFETSTLSGWTDADSGTGSPASTETTTAGEFRSGTKALKLYSDTPAGTAARYQTISARPGEYRKATFYIKGDATATVSLYLTNTVTGRSYNGSSWGSYAAAVSQAASGSFVAVTVTYQVESYEACGTDSVSLTWRISMAPSSGAATAYVDDCSDVPGITFASIHGHNLSADPTVESSDDDSSWTTRATMTRKRPAFWTSFAIVYARYWKIAWASAQTATYIGEAVLGQYETSATSPQWGLTESRDIPGVRTRGPSGRHAVYNYATDPPRGITMTFSARTAAAARELSDSLWLRSGQGLYPAVIVPIDTETGVYYGRLTAPHEQPRPFQGVYNCDLALVGDPFPVVTT